MDELMNELSIETENRYKRWICCCGDCEVTIEPTGEVWAVDRRVGIEYRIECKTCGKFVVEKRWFEIPPRIVKRDENGMKTAIFYFK